MFLLYASIINVMKKYLIVFLFVGFGLNANSVPFYYNGVDNVVGGFDQENIVVNTGAVVTSNNVDGITVDYAPVVLHNNGTINGSINVNDNILYIYNTGTINGDIITNSIGSAIQMITSENEVTPVHFVGNNSRMNIDGVQNVNFDTIKNNNATYVDIKSSGKMYVTINNFQDWQNWDKTISLNGANGPIILVISDKNTVTNNVAINHAISGDNISVKITNLEDLYKVELEDDGANIILHIVRETDYDKVFNDSSELEQIRQKHPNDKLLKMLDGLDNVDEINRVKNLSYRFNHGILLRPIKVINNFIMTDMIRDKTDAGAGFIPFCITSDKMNILGGRLYLGHDFDNVYFNAGFNVNYFSYKDKINDFSGIAYGLDLRVKEQFDNLWTTQTVGLSMAKFKADLIQVNDDIKNNPFGFSGYGEALVGYDINVSPDMVIAPFGGIAYQMYKVLDEKDTDCYARGGADAKYSFVMDGIKYEYLISVSIGSNGNMFSTLRVGFWSITDLAGASLDAGIIKDDLDYHYKLSATAKMLF